MREDPERNPGAGAGPEPARRGVQTPGQIPRGGWKSILKRTKDDLGHDHLSTVSAGVGLFLLLGIIPGLAALISIYGLISNPDEIQRQFGSFRNVVPEQVYDILIGQMKTIASSSKTAGWGALIGILVSLWGGTTGLKALMDGLNIACHEDEKRGFLRLNLTALVLTLAAVIGLCVIIAVLAAVPALVGKFHPGQTGRQVVLDLRWPVLFGVFMVGLAVLYRYGPSRAEPRWRWISWGAFTGAALWLAASALFTVYLTCFNSYNKTYGSLGAVVVLLLWLQLSAYAVLAGAELDFEVGRQAAREPKPGPPQSRGWRGAFAADHSR